MRTIPSTDGIIMGDDIVYTEEKRNGILKTFDNLEDYYRHEVFEMLVNRATDVVVLFTVDDNTVSYVSPNIDRMMGLTAAELKQDYTRLTDTVVEPELLLTEEALVNLVAEGGEGPVRKHIHQKTGETCWFQMSVLPGRFKDSKKFLLLFSDRTNDRKAQEQLAQALAIARSACEGKSTFLANMSHDIRTPMNAIIGFSHLVEQERQNPEKVREYTRKIASAGKHMLSLLDDLLDMSRLETGKASMDLAEFNLSELLEELHETMQPHWQAKKMDFQMRVVDLRWELLIGNRTRIAQILQKLLTNAVQYTPEGGKICFTVTQLEQVSHRFANLRFEVQDNGIGMAPEFLPHVFEPFSREKNTTMSGVSGTGLGLAIVKNLVDLMGGTIRVESEQGTGTTFTVELALQLTEQEMDVGFWNEQNIHRLLTVDTEEYICRGVAVAMEHTGVVVEHTGSGGRAITMVREAKQAGAPYDVILLDRKLPDLDGLEAARQIRAEVGEQTLILLLTSEDWSTLEKAALQAGVSGYMAKPFFITNFRKRIEALRVELQRKEEAEAIQNVLSGLQILVVEDNELNAEIMSSLLELENAKCDLAENGQVALEMFNASPPGFYDLILMDIQMPVMNGYESTRAIRASQHPDAKTIPISAMTANAFAEDVEASMGAGMNAHIPKPVDFDLMKAEVYRLLKEKKN